MLEEDQSRQEQASEALLAALIEIERFVAKAGWDQPARLFGLVPTQDLIAAQPQLADQLTVTAPDALSSVEQEEFNLAGQDLLTVLGHIFWPESITGCALATERSFLPAEYEAEIPANLDDASQFVANHPKRQDLRVVAGALRPLSPDQPAIMHCVARLSSDPKELLVGADMVPALTNALAFTLENQLVD